jgi:hypothetical protein
LPPGEERTGAEGDVAAKTASQNGCSGGDDMSALEMPGLDSVGRVGEGEKGREEGDTTMSES